MNFHPDLAPAMRNTRQKNNAFLAQSRLKSRNPAGEGDWEYRYAERFAELYKVDDAFRELVNAELNLGTLASIQHRLDLV